MLVFMFFSLFAAVFELANFAVFFLVESTLSIFNLLDIGFLFN
jgi:hypothetical protein